jgi:hypothetical protein
MNTDVTITDFKHDSLSLRREANAFFPVLPLGLCWLQSEVRLRQPDHFT